jgi:uncharacterized protein (TIGR03083 family)
LLNQQLIGVAVTNLDSATDAALRASVARLRDLVEPMTGDQLTAQAYPTEWTVAQVLSHLGSAAVISQARLAAGLNGESLPDDFAPRVWDEWNAKAPSEMAADSLHADVDLMAALAAVTEQQRADVVMPLGPITMTVDLMAEFRLNEHAVHSWDIAVAFDPAATLAADAVDLVVDRLAMIVGWTAKPDGRPRVIGVHTTAPQRHFALTIAADGVALEPTDADDRHDLELTLPAEAFLRLVYGRLDADHTPAELANVAEIAALRAVFAGV